MSTNNECPNCGAINGTNIKICKYCGTANPNYVVQPVAPHVTKADDISNAINKTTEQIKKSNFNIVIFIILLIIFWPLAIVYLMVKIFKSAK